MRITALILLASFFSSSGAAFAESFPAPACDVYVRPVIGVSPEEWDEYSAKNGDLLTLPLLNADEITSRNSEVLKTLRDGEFLPKTQSSRKSSLSLTEVKAFYRQIIRNPQVQQSLCGTYRRSNDLGFCWGRAMAVHLVVLFSGLRKQSIRKLWAVGKMKSGKSSWRYHVTTIVLGENHIWYAIDPIFEDAMPVEDWAARMRKDFDPDGKVRLIQPKRIGMILKRKKSTSVRNSRIVIIIISSRIS